MDRCINNASDANGRIRTVRCCGTRTNCISARRNSRGSATDTAANNGNGPSGHWVAPTSGPAFQHRIELEMRAHMQRGTKTTSVVSRPASRTYAYHIANRSANFRLGNVKTSYNVTVRFGGCFVLVEYGTLERSLLRDVRRKVHFLFIAAHRRNRGMIIVRNYDVFLVISKCIDGYRAHNNCSTVRSKFSAAFNVCLLVKGMTRTRAIGYYSKLLTYYRSKVEFYYRFPRSKYSLHNSCH